MKKIGLVVAILLVATLAHADFDWGAYWYFYDSGGSTFLANNAGNTVGAFAQLIWDVDGDGLDTPVNSGTGIAPGSDDVVYWASWFGENAGVAGQFSGAGTPETVTAGAPQDGEIFYARVWSAPAATWNANASTITTTANYWDGLQLTYSDGATLTYNMTGISGSPYNANITVDGVTIPEPTVFALGALGLILVRAFRRKK